LNEQYHVVEIEAFLGYQSLVKRALLKYRNGLTKTQTMVLGLLSEEAEFKMSTLASRMAVSREQASRAVAGVVEMGLVERRRSTSDGKVVKVSLTDAGRMFLDRQQRECSKMISSELASLTQAERDELHEVSRAAIRLISKALGDGASG
jgi:DNA-binding MarR family transcriptional regulator